MRWCWFPLILFALSACDRSPPPAVTAAAPRAKEYQLELRPVTPLLPNRTTHVAVDGNSNIYWVCETESGADLLFVIGESTVPRATQLASRDILAALQIAGGTGNIHSITAGPEGEIYFYFQGTKGRKSASCIGRFDQRSGEVRILLDDAKLQTASGMGSSIGLARGKLIASQPWIWVWIRHSDDAVLMRFDARGLAKASGIEMAGVFKSDVKGLPVGVTKEDDSVSAGPKGSLLWTSPGNGEVRTISPEGRSTLLRGLGGISGALSTAAIDSAGRLVIFAADAAVIPTRADSLAPPTIAYPAMLLFDGDKIIPIERDEMLAYPGFHLPTLRLNELCPDGTGGWVAYDSASGELMRLKITEHGG